MDIIFYGWMTMKKKTKASLKNKKFKPVLDKEYHGLGQLLKQRWKIDFNKLLQGPDLKKFVDDKLFPSYHLEIKQKTLILLNTK